MDVSWIEKHDPIQERPAVKWEQGIALGNGKIGAMVWGGGEGKPLILSLDQAEVWDLRAYTPPKDKSFQEYKELLKEKRGAEMEGFACDQEKPHVMRIPVGRLELFTSGTITAHTSRLRLLQGRCEGTLQTETGEIPYAVWVSAQKQLAVLECEAGALRPNWKFVCRDGDYTLEDSEEATAYHHQFRMSDMVKAWRYPPFQETDFGEIKCFSQTIPESGGFAAACLQRENHMLISLQWSRASEEAAREQAVAAVEEGRKEGLEELRREHDAWWENYYQASCITIPDTRLEGYYYLQMYMLASSTRPHGVHMTMCGPWTDDNNMMPICGNDYHWNNEQQMQMWPVYASNRIEFGEPMLEMIEANLDTLKEVCEFHFKTEGAFLAHSTDPYLRPSYSNTDNFELNGLPWVCFHYWKRYLYTMDHDFLKNRAYPVMKLAIGPILAELTPGEDGKLHLPWTSSPEYHGINETLRWLDKEEPDWSTRFGPDATLDLALTRFLLDTLCKASIILDCDEELRRKWQETLENLTPYALDDLGGLAVRADVYLKTSHRHMSHLFPIYPIGEMTMKTHEKLINRSLDIIGMNGRGEWVGWTFPWVSLIYNRAGRSAAARNVLLDYVDRYVTETGIHYQGPQGACDISLYGNRDGVFGQSIEAQLGVPEAIHELLLRTEDGVVRVFRDAPPAWAGCGFRKLRVEGAFLLDAKRTMYRTEYVRIYAEKGGTITIDTDLGEGTLRGGVTYENGLYTAEMKAGESLLFYRGEKPELEFTPEEGNPGEEHFWGVKNIRRF